MPLRRYSWRFGLSRKRPPADMLPAQQEPEVSEASCQWTIGAPVLALDYQNVQVSKQDQQRQ
jgi:hypothetical protein